MSYWTLLISLWYSIHLEGEVQLHCVGTEKNLVIRWQFLTYYVLYLVKILITFIFVLLLLCMNILFDHDIMSTPKWISTIRCASHQNLKIASCKPRRTNRQHIILWTSNHRIMVIDFKRPSSFCSKSKKWITLQKVILQSHPLVYFKTCVMCLGHCFAVFIQFLNNHFKLLWFVSLYIYSFRRNGIFMAMVKGLLESCFPDCWDWLPMPWLR